MKIDFNDDQYQYNVKKWTSQILSLYAVLRTSGIETKDGKHLSFAKDSLLRTALKAIMAPFFIPFLKDLYRDKGLELPPPLKHADLIDYFIINLIHWIDQVEETLYVKATIADETSGDSRKTISTILATWQERSFITRGDSKQAETDTTDSGRIPYIYGWQNGDGENTFENGDSS